MKPIKRKLALGTAITLLIMFGVETMAIASPNIMSQTVITKNDCGGDDEDPC